MGSAYDDYLKHQTAAVPASIPGLDVTIVGTRRGRALYRLNRPIVYRLCVGGLRLIVRVPRDYLTDLASIPWIVTLLLPVAGPWRFAAIIHDYLCEVHGVERAVADAVLWQIMGETREIRAWQRVAIYGAVRAYWIFWRKWTRRVGHGQRPTGDGKAA